MRPEDDLWGLKSVIDGKFYGELNGFYVLIWSTVRGELKKVEKALVCTSQG